MSFKNSLTITFVREKNFACEFFGVVFSDKAFASQKHSRKLFFVFNESRRDQALNPGNVYYAEMVNSIHFCF